MIRNGLKNYFISLKHFFTPLGTMFLGMMIGVSFFIPGVISAFTSLIKGIRILGDSLQLDFNVLWNHLWNRILDLDWTMPSKALEILLSKNWLNQSLTEILNTILGTDFETFKNQIVVLVNSFTQEIIIWGIVFLVWWILGFLIGHVLLRFLIRRRIAKRGLWKFILSVIIGAILTTVFTMGCAFLFTLWSPSIFISSLLGLLLVGLYELLEAYLIHGRKKVNFRKIVNIGNIGKYILTNILIFVISLTISLIVFSINKLLGVFVGISLFEIASLVISMNAESYVIEMAKLEVNLS